jgi:hypothetical protein
LSCYKSGNVKEVQWDMGSKLYPEFPLKLENDGVINLYSSNLQSYNMWRNHALGSSVDDTNFWTTEATSHAKGGSTATTAFKAAPVRRVYGTWVANGPQQYSAANHKPVDFAIAAADKATGAGKVATAGSPSNAELATLIDSAVAAVNVGGLPTIPMTLTNTKKNPLTKVQLANANTVQFTHMVPTLSFVPDNARDIHLVQSGMRCKIGCSATEQPEDETTPNGNIDIASSRVADVGTADYTNLADSTLGLDRFFLSTPANVYTVNANAVAAKNTNYEQDSKNVMYAGAPTHVAWAHTASGAAGAGSMAARQVVGVGVPFVDGSNRPILSSRAGTAFKGWVEILPDDESFYLGCNFETHPESSDLVSGSDLTNATPLHLRLEYAGTANGTANFFEGRDNNDPFTSFVHIDAVLRLQEDGTVISSV